MDYGFNSDDIQLDKAGLPVGIHKVMITDEELNEKKALVVNFEIVEGDMKGKGGKVWYNINHENVTTSNIAKQAIKRIADATGKPVSNTSPLKGRVLVIEVAEQKKDPRYTEIKKYLPADYKPAVNDDIPS